MSPARSTGSRVGVLTSASNDPVEISLDNAEWSAVTPTPTNVYLMRPTMRKAKYCGASTRMTPAMVGSSARLMRYSGTMPATRLKNEKKVSSR